MTSLYEKIVSEHGSGRDWMDKVPGLRGYLDKSDRRTADRMMREHVATELTNRLNRYVGIEKQILRDGGLALMGITRDAKTKFQIYIDRVKTAAPGYSGFFAAIKVDDAAMERLYAFDEAQLRYLDQFDIALTGLEEAVKAGEGVEDKVQAIYNLAQEADEAFRLREKVITEIDSALT
ncbi:MAG: hypothetical protein ACOYL5_00470 [Phototrophicaceae bacterium]|jgi:hypothetical protein